MLHCMTMATLLTFAGSPGLVPIESSPDDDALEQAKEAYLRVRKDADLELIKAYDERIRELNREGKREEAAELRRERDKWVEHEKRELASFPNVITGDRLGPDRSPDSGSAETPFAEQYTAFCIRCERLYADMTVDRAARLALTSSNRLASQFRNSATLHAKLESIDTNADGKTVLGIRELLGFDEGDQIRHAPGLQLIADVPQDIVETLEPGSVVVLQGTPVVAAAKNLEDFQYVTAPLEVDVHQLLDTAQATGVFVQLYFLEAEVISVKE